MPNPNKSDKKYWEVIASLGCVPCLMDGRFNNYGSIHHIDGRTKPGAHKKVLFLCAGHHQKGTGNNPDLIAVHPDKARFEERYGDQEVILEAVNNKILEMGLLNERDIF